MNPEQQTATSSTEPTACQCIDWYSEGQGREVVINGHVITVRLVARKGRRSRIAITVPAGARFLSISCQNT